MVRATQQPRLMLFYLKRPYPPCTKSLFLGLHLEYPIQASSPPPLFPRLKTSKSLRLSSRKGFATSLISQIILKAAFTRGGLSRHHQGRNMGIFRGPLHLLALQFKPNMSGLRAPEHPLFTPSLVVLIQVTWRGSKMYEFDRQSCVDYAAIRWTILYVNRCSIYYPPMAWRRPFVFSSLSLEHARPFWCWQRWRKNSCSLSHLVMSACNAD